VEVRVDGLGEVAEDIAALELEGRADRQDPLDEPGAGL